MTSLKLEFLFGPGSRGLAVTKRHVSVRHWSDTSVRRPLHDSQLDAVIGAKKHFDQTERRSLCCVFVQDVTEWWLLGSKTATKLLNGRYPWNAGNNEDSPCTTHAGWGTVCAGRAFSHILQYTLRC